MNICKIKPVDIANGPGCRVSVFVSGCNNHCKGCFNEEAWDFNAGELCDGNKVKEILSYLDHPYIRGLSILGGEPLDLKNVGYVVELMSIVKAKYPDKDIWLYTGYRLEDLLGRFGDRALFLDYADVIVDGPFILDEKDISLTFRGSKNQRIIDVKSSVWCNHIVDISKQYDDYKMH